MGKVTDVRAKVNPQDVNPECLVDVVMSLKSSTGVYAGKGSKVRMCLTDGSEISGEIEKIMAGYDVRFTNGIIINLSRVKDFVMLG